MTKDQKDMMANTEEILYHYTSTVSQIQKLKAEIEKLENMDTDVLSGSSQSVISASGNSSVCRDIFDKFDAQIKHLRSSLRLHEREMRAVKRALNAIKKDHFYKAIECKYFMRMTDRQVCKLLDCSISTLRRNREKLVWEITRSIYGIRKPLSRKST